MIQVLQNKALAWTRANNVKIKDVDKKVIVDNAETLLKSLHSIVVWADESIDGARPKPPSLAQIKPLVDLFGYDAYTGDLWRGVRVDKELEIGAKIVLKTLHDTVSWTPRQKVAQRFASRRFRAGLGREPKKYGYVLRLNSSGQQYLSMPWAHEVCTAIGDAIGKRKVSMYDSIIGFFAEKEQEVLVIHSQRKYVATVVKSIE